MSTDKKPVPFEEKLEALETLVTRMEEGELSLDELLATYEQGVKLADSLKKDLENAQNRLSELKQGALKPIEEA
mgnify:CR=1 FL=1